MNEVLSDLEFRILMLYMKGMNTAEICKITYVVIMASVMASHQNRPSAITSVMHLVFYLGLIVGFGVFGSGGFGELRRWRGGASARQEAHRQEPGDAPCRSFHVVNLFFLF